LHASLTFEVAFLLDIDALTSDHCTEGVLAGGDFANASRARQDGDGTKSTQHMRHEMNDG
jgi:hypothetical protein